MDEERKPVTIKELLAEYRNASTPMAAGMLAFMLSESVAEDIAQRETVEKERAMLVTSSWVTEIGFTLHGQVEDCQLYVTEYRCLAYRLTVDVRFWKGMAHSCDVHIGQYPLLRDPSRGQLLDLLASLGISIKTAEVTQ